MATATPQTFTEPLRGGDYFCFEGAGWDLYDQIDAWAGDRSGVRLVYLDGDLEVMGKTRRHDWYGLRIHDLVTALATDAGLHWEDAGETTFRIRSLAAGSQGDQTFYFGENAVRMAGPKNFEPGVDPVPDLVLEVEVGNSVKRALAAWLRLGVREVWHLNPAGEKLRLTVLRLRDDGAAFEPAVRSGFLPISDVQILELLNLAAGEAARDWRVHLPQRIAEVLGRNG